MDRGRLRDILHRFRRSRAFPWLRDLVRQVSYLAAEPQDTVARASVLFTMRVAGVAIGQARLNLYPEARGEMAGAWLVGLYVHPLFRRMGLGRDLTLAVIREARTRQQGVLRLFVREDNTAARRLYEELGFTVIPTAGTAEEERKRLEALEGEPHVAMGLELVHTGDTD